MGERLSKSGLIKGSSFMNSTNHQFRTCIPCPKIEQDSYEWYDRHELKLCQVKEMLYDIVFIGDSITHFWHLEPGSHANGEEVWQEYYSQRKVFNLGYGFDRPQNVLWRLEHDELEGQVPKLFVVNLGTNCYSITENYSGDSPEVAAEGVKAVVNKLLEMSLGAKVLLMAVLPRGFKKDFDNMQRKVDELNVLLEAFSANNPRIVFINLRSQFRDENDEIRSELYIDQCCHPNIDGYRIWAKAIEPEIKAVLG